MALETAQISNQETGVRIGNRIRDAREALGLTQTELAKRVADIAGACSRSGLAQWERGVAQPSYAILPVLAKVLEMTPAQLAFGDGSTEDMSKARITKSAIPNDFVMVPEVRFSAEKSGDTPTLSVVTNWGLPTRQIEEMVSGEANDLAIVRVEGKTAGNGNYDDGTPLYIDRADLTPDGSVMAFWDGYNVQFAAVRPVVLGERGMVEVFLGGEPQRGKIEDLALLGKVVGQAR